MLGRELLFKKLKGGHYPREAHLRETLPMMEEGAALWPPLWRVISYTGSA